MKKILISDAVSQSALGPLAGDDFKVDYEPEISAEDLAGQIGEYEGRKRMYVVTSLAEDQEIEYSVSRGRPKSGKPLVSLRKMGRTRNDPMPCRTRGAQ